MGADVKGNRMEKVFFIREFDKNESIDFLPCANVMVGTYKTNIEKKLKRLLIKNGWSKCVFEKELKDFDLLAYNLIIVEEIFSWNPIFLLEYLREKNPKACIVYWLRNTLFLEKYKNGISRENIEAFLDTAKRYNFQIASFDKGDCTAYGMLYVPQCIIREPGLFKRVDKRASVLKYDLFWAGKDKKRVGFLEKIKRYCDEVGLTYKFAIYPDKKMKYSEELSPFLLQRGNLPYCDIIKIDLESRAILDIVQKGQQGLTYRPIESLFLRKKLITTYEGIKQYDFYRAANILVVNENNISEIKEFLKIPYEDVPLSIVEKYTFNGMVEQMHHDIVLIEN